MHASRWASCHQVNRFILIQLKLKHLSLYCLVNFINYIIIIPHYVLLLITVTVNTESKYTRRLENPIYPELSLLKMIQML